MIRRENLSSTALPLGEHMTPSRELRHEEPTGRPCFRFKFRFGRCAIEMMRVDEALDQIGQRKFGTGWGPQARLHELPLFRRYSKKELFTVELTKDGRRHIKVISDLEGNLSDVELKFEQSWKELRRTIRNNILEPLIIRKQYKEVRLVKSFMTSQRVNLFGTGTVLYHGERCVVWIERKQFAEWIESRFLPTRTLLDEEQERIRQAFLGILQTTTLKQIARRQMVEVLREAMGIQVSKKSLDDLMAYIHKNNKGGRPVEGKRWADAKEKLLAYMRSAQGLGY
jgi:hypothetical protein